MRILHMVHGVPPTGMDGNRTRHLPPWRTMAYFTLRRFLLPAYRAAQGGHAYWIVALKDKVKRILLSAP